MNVKKICRVFLLLFCIMLPVSVYSATRADIKIIEASEGIRYLSQKLGKEYLFFYLYPNDQEVKKNLKVILSKLSEHLRVIASTTKDDDTKDILEFLSYSKEKIETIINANANEERALLILDHSDTLLEGVNAIESAHKYDFSMEEKMLMTTKDLEYLSERIAKYYMAVNLGFNTKINKNKMLKSIDELDSSMKIINNYSYTYTLKKEQLALNGIWEENKKYFIQSSKLFIPNLLLSSVEYFENVVAKISLYHNKNQ